MTLRSLFGLVDLLLSGQEKIGKAIDWVKDKLSGDAEPMPLTHKAVERINAIEHRAGHERDEIRPPPKSSRYD